jgi:hypothetical protein
VVGVNRARVGVNRARVGVNRATFMQCINLAGDGLRPGAESSVEQCSAVQCSAVQCSAVQCSAGLPPREEVGAVAG